MKSTSKKATGCGLAAASFLMLSAFNSEASEALSNTEELPSVGMIAGEIGIDIEDVAEAVEESKEAAAEDMLESAEAAEADTEVSEWDDKAMADIQNALNVRAEAGLDSDVVGAVYKGGAVDIIEEGEEWTLIRSGDVEGYVATEYLAFAEAAKEIAERDGRKIATVQTDGLRVRKGPGTDESIIGFLNKGNELEVEEEDDDWIKVVYQGGSYYISARYAEVEWDLEHAKTAEQIEQERKEEEERKATEARKAAEAAEAAQASSAAVSSSSTSETASSAAAEESSQASVSASASDLELLAAIIECEAGGESYDGKVAVGAVVMNRVRSGSFPNSISGVIYQSGQFTPASSGKLSTVLSKGANSSCVQAAQDALNGSNNVGSALYFRNASAGKGTIIGNHCFY